jgi:hypothetical protein
VNLSPRIRTDRSTILHSDKKFQKEGLIRFLNVPSGEAIGAEIVTVVFVRYTPPASFEVRRDTKAHNDWINYPNCVYHVSTDTHSVSVFYSRNLTDFKVNFKPIIDDYYQNNFVEDIQYFFFPTQISSYVSELPWALDRLFHLERADLPQEVTLPNVPLDEKSKLTEKDKLALYGFVKYPRLPELTISNLVGLSRITIADKSTTFVQRGIICWDACMDWQKLCCELLTFYHIKLRAGQGIKELNMVHTTLRNVGAPLFSYLQLDEIFGAFLSKNYSEFKNMTDSAVKMMVSQGLIEDRPTMVIMPLSDIKANKVDYAPLVQKMLGIKILE